MARRTATTAEPRPAILSTDRIATAIPKLERGLTELEAVEIEHWNDAVRSDLDALQMKIEETLVDVFCPNTLEMKRYEVHDFAYSVSMHSFMTEPEWVDGYRKAITRAIGRLNAAISMLRERLDDMGVSLSGQALRAYEGLDLHPGVEFAAGALYRDGHYASAIEDSVKALNGLVRMRSGLEEDGVTLMQRAFSPKNPILKFNDLADDSDRDEQLGYMNMFSGAVSGLRNPRAHKLIQDDPERALEFIAFVSLLAKLLEGTKKA